jgi:DNA (cytosine-5)-methyltransferase 1
MIKVGSDFSGVGAFDQALIRLGIKHETLFACDMDKYARQTYILNYGEPKYYPSNVYDREIPKESLDIYMTSPPCQAFSLAGKRLGKEDKRGLLFFNSLEFIQTNKPRYFIFENVKGLLSHDKVDPKAVYGRTFQEWSNYLGGKSVNGVHTFFPYEDAVPYHVYYQVLNAKHYGVPQNRERIFIIGIRDDEDNNFSFPKPYPLEKRLKDVLESEVDEKYFLSDKMLKYLISNSEIQKNNGNGFKFSPSDGNTIGKAVTTKAGQRMDDEFVKVSKEVRTEESKLTRKETGTNNFRGKEIEFREQEFMNTITTSLTNDHFIILANNSKGYDIAEEEEDSINFSVPTSETRRGRVGKKVSQTLDTQCNQGIATKQLSKQQLEKLQNLEVDENVAGCITEAIGRAGSSDEYISSVKRNAILTQRIRRLTPLECFKLMDFNENFKWDVSDSQAYRQAGNSICVGVLALIISKLKL